MTKLRLPIILCACILLAGCGATPAEPAPEEVVEEVIEDVVEFDLVQYKADALELKTLIYDDATILVNVAKSEVGLLENKKKLGSTKTNLDERNITVAFSYYKTTPDELNENNTKIRKMYKDFFVIENDGSKEATEIEESIKILYENYSVIIDKVQQEGSTAQSISMDVSTSAKELIKAADNIDLFCEE